MDFIILDDIIFVKNVFGGIGKRHQECGFAQNDQTGTNVERVSLNGNGDTRFETFPVAGAALAVGPG